jgi:serine/threonine protein kinase
MDVGAEFSHYRVIEHIGRGGMADVWSARDKRLNRTVAVKTILRDLSPESDPFRLFEQEAQTIARLEHPHILPIYDYGDYEGRLYIVMRFVTGGSLEDLLSSGPLPTDQVIRHARAIAGALDYAHTNQVIHLDLKPSNILLDSNQSPYLADFGLAAVLGPEGRAANPGYGTLLYMAPEQLTAGEIDHRADIYSFAILLFQMLSGELPFDATTSLALKQIQWQEEMPEITRIDDELAEMLTPVLRRGTALDPNERPATLLELVTELENTLGQIRGTIADASGGLPDDYVGSVTIDLNGVATMADQSAIARREAVDIYERARRAWAHGQGRFLLGVTHFMVMNDVYMHAEEEGIQVDEAGLQMLLRGALEYDVEVDYWWNKLDNDNRRWVALHAIRSESAPARTRALYRLETIPDSDPPRIPGLVAQALSAETNDEAKRAAIQVLGTRAKRGLPAAASGRFPALQPQGLTGRLLTVRTREDIQLLLPSDWRDSVYSEDIDGLLADIALTDPTPAAAELAARTVGRIRSLAAVRKIAEAQRGGSAKALRALALVRDEAPSLPSIVSPRARLYAWLDNTWRRLTDDPLRNVRRFVAALIGAAVAMGGYVFVTFRSELIFNAERWGRTISIGLTFGMFIAILAILAGELPARLRGFWPGWARVLVSGIIGLLWGTFTWGAFTWFFLNYPPNWEVMFYAGLGTMLGFVLAALFNLRGWAAVLLTAITTFLPILIFFRFYWTGELPVTLPISAEVQANPVAIMYFDVEEQVFTVALPVVLLIALGGHAQSFWKDIQALWNLWRASRAKPTA